MITSDGKKQIQIHNMIMKKSRRMNVNNEYSLGFHQPPKILTPSDISTLQHIYHKCIILGIEWKDNINPFLSNCPQEFKKRVQSLNRQIMKKRKDKHSFLDK